VNSLGRRSRRAVAVSLGLVLLSFDPALAYDSGGAGVPPPAPAPTPPTPAAGAPVAPTGAASNAWADAAVKTFDVVPIRMLSVSAVVIGFGAFLVSVPLVGPGFQMEGIRNSWDYFVMAPVEYTFVRPLGDF